MSVNKNGAAWLSSTTGAGIAVGTNVGISSILISSAATTVTIVNSAGTFTMITASSIDFYPPVAAQGPITATSSGGSFGIAFVPE